MLILKKVFALSSIIGVFLNINIAYAVTLNLYTEEYPPYNMIINPTKQEIGGASTEVIRTLLDKANIKYNISLVPWARAQSSAHEGIYNGLYSIARTPERENTYKWVGPITSYNWVFFSKSDSTIMLKTLDEAKKYSVGGYRGDATAKYLQDLGFDLQITNNDEQNIQKLSSGHIDLLASGNLTAPYIAKKSNIKLRNVLVIKEANLYLGLNEKAPQELVDNLNNILKQMHQDGTIANILKKYD